jgi:hypothetical protein
MSIENKMYNSERKENTKSVNGSETYVASAHINSLSKKYNKLNQQPTPERKNAILDSLRNNFPTFIDLASGGWNIAKQTKDATTHIFASRTSPNIIKASDYSDDINSVANSVLQQKELQTQVSSEQKPKIDRHSRTTLTNDEYLFGQGFNMIPNKRPMYNEPLTKEDKKFYNDHIAPIEERKVPIKPGAMPSKEHIHISDDELASHVIIKPKNPTPDTFQTREELIADLDKKGIQRIIPSQPSNEPKQTPKKAGFLSGILRGLEKRNEKKEKMLEIASKLKELQSLTLYQLDYSEQKEGGLLVDKSKQIVKEYNRLQSEVTSSVSKEAVDIKLTLSQIKDALIKAGFTFSKFGSAISPNNTGFKSYNSHENLSAGLTAIKSTKELERDRIKIVNRDEELAKKFEMQSVKHHLFDNNFIENDLATPLQNLQGKINSFQNIPQTPLELAVLQEFIDESFAPFKNSYNQGVLLFSVEPNDETQLKYNPNTKHFIRDVADNLLDIPKNYTTIQGAETAIALLKKLNSILIYSVKPRQNKFEIVVTDPALTTDGFEDRSYR